MLLQLSYVVAAQACYRCLLRDLDRVAWILEAALGVAADDRAVVGKK